MGSYDEKQVWNLLIRQGRGRRESVVLTFS
jgi:hypothetical protein